MELGIDDDGALYCPYCTGAGIVREVFHAVGTPTYLCTCGAYYSNTGEFISQIVLPND